MTTPLITNQMTSFQIYKRLLGYIKKSWWAFLLGIFGTILSSGTDASITWSLKPLLDKGFIAKDQSFIHWLPILVIGAFLMRGIASFLSSFFMARVGRNVVFSLRKQVFNHLLQLPADFYDGATSGQLLSLIIYNVDQVAKAGTDSLVTIVQESCFVTGELIVMLMISWKLTLLFLVTAPIIALLTRYTSLLMRGLSRNVQEGMGNLTHVAEETIEGYKVIRTFAGEEYEASKFNDIITRNRSRELRLVATNSLATSSIQQILSFVIAVTIYLATSHAAAITAGGFAAMLAAMLAILKPMKNLSTVSNTIQKGIAGAESIFKLLDEATEKDTGTHKMTRAKGSIQFSNVEFTYNRSQQAVLHRINFEVNAGERVAIVGRSGSGKTTLVNLLPRFYDNYSGTIKIDNVDIRSLCLADLRNQFTLVSQHVVLFNDTIGHNIAYGRLRDTSEAKIIETAEAAHAMEFISRLPQGLNTQVGENGVLLSGGQRQRIAIARALLKDAPILILDEATSALDTESERHIQDALSKLMANRTTLIIAHRLSTIENADKIIVVESGQVVEMGTHSELLTHNGHYAKLHRMQFRDVEIA
jgi:ATP-binding cassette, subfamily B, bacterial MsbA